MYINYNGTINEDCIDYGITEVFPELLIQGSKVADTMSIKQDGQTIKLTEYQADELHYIISQMMGYDTSMHRYRAFYKDDDE